MNAGSASTQVERWSAILWIAGVLFYGVVPECRLSASGMVLECIMSAKMVTLNASGTVSHSKNCNNTYFGHVVCRICFKKAPW